jgi:hypothetical protein
VVGGRRAVLALGTRLVAARRLAVMTLPIVRPRVVDERRIGMFEHADHVEPRREHGYCTDDMARLLIVAVRDPTSQAVRELGRTAFRFLARRRAPRAAHRIGGPRRPMAGRHGVEDCWGRSRVGLRDRRTPCAGGLDARPAPCRTSITASSSVHRTDAPWRSPRSAPPRSSSSIHDTSGRGRLLADAVADRSVGLRSGMAVARTSAVLRQRGASPTRSSPPDTHSGARRARRRADALAMAARPRDRRRPPVADAGRWRRPGDGPGRFDQQPIEAATLAEACARAWAVTAPTSGAAASISAVGWFAGANDVGSVMWDTDDLGRLRRADRRRTEPQSRRRVDPRADLHDAAPPAA